MSATGDLIHWPPKYGRLFDVFAKSDTARDVKEYSPRETLTILAIAKALPVG
jgi:hypothetical protein